VVRPISCRRPAGGRRALAGVAVILAITAAASGLARADGGYFSGALGARASGRGGAFVARADDLTAVYTNPAGLAQLEGTTLQLGNRLSYNAFAFTRAPTLDYGHMQGGVAPRVSFTEVQNSTPWQALEPFLGLASKLGTRDWAFAVAAFAPPGTSKVTWPLDGGERYLMVAREAIILDYTATVAYSPNDRFGVGASFVWIHVPRLNYSLVIDGSPFAGAANPVSSDLDMYAQTSGSAAFTPNAIVGAWARPTPAWQIGVAGQVLPATVRTQSRLDVTPLSTSLGTLVLTRDGAPANDVHVVLPMPLLARAGARYRSLAGGQELWDVELDVEYETWSRVKKFSVETNRIQANYGGQTLDIARIDIPKQWRDTVTVKTGGDYAAVPGVLALRGGAYFVSAVSAPAYANVDFPSGARVGGGVGASWVVSPRFELAFAYNFQMQLPVDVSEKDARVYQQVPGSACQAPYTDPSTCNPSLMGQPSPVVNAGHYSAFSHLASLGLIYRWQP